MHRVDRARQPGGGLIGRLCADEHGVLEPLAAATGLTVVVDQRLTEGSAFEPVLDLLAEHAPPANAAKAAVLAAATPEDGEVSLLVAPMIPGNRELIAGLSRDEQFGMTVMLGIGGILAEAIADVAIRLVPITADDATSMLDELEHQSLLGAFRGEVEVDRAAVVATLMALNDAAVANPELVSVDLNPLIINAGRPVAVDALVELTDDQKEAPTEAPAPGAAR